MLGNRRTEIELYAAAIVAASSDILIRRDFNITLHHAKKLTKASFLALGIKEGTGLHIYASTSPLLMHVSGGNNIYSKTIKNKPVVKRNMHSFFENILPTKEIENLEYGTKTKYFYTIAFRNQILIYGSSKELTATKSKFLQSLLEIASVGKELPDHEQTDLYTLDRFIEDHIRDESALETAGEACHMLIELEGVIAAVIFLTNTNPAYAARTKIVTENILTGLEQKHLLFNCQTAIETEKLLAENKSLPSHTYIYPLLVKDKRIGSLLVFSEKTLKLTRQDILSSFAGKAAPLFQVLANIDEKEHLTEAMEKQLVQFAGNNQEKDTILSMVSHELRAPATVIRNAVSLIMEMHIESENNSFIEKIQMIHEAAQHELSIITSLLEASRIKRNQMELFIQDTDVSQLIDVSVKELQIEAARKGLYLHYTRNDIPLIKADKTRIREVIDNIIINGIKYTITGGVDVTTASDNESIKIIIKDTGKGIAKDRQKKLFHMFQRLSETTAGGRESGLGLGLYIVKNIIEAHHGSISIDSLPGTGSTFTISLPLG